MGLDLESMADMARRKPSPTSNIAAQAHFRCICEHYNEVDEILTEGVAYDNISWVFFSITSR